MKKILRSLFSWLIGGFILRLLIPLLILGGGGYMYLTPDPEFVPEIRTTTVSQGNIVDSVGATGTLEAVTTVNVGSQVSGIIDELNVDFNSIVRKGEVIMRLDPSLFETQVAQGRANLVRAQADTERLRVSLDDAVTQLERAEDLAKRELISVIELEAAQVTVRSTEAQIKSSEAAIIQAEASLNQNQVNLEHTVIRAPIDGIVISRLVDVGQTVAASLQAPELFVIAADLSKMRVIANIDESDVGRIRPQQRVTFSVDAFPGEEFEGSVTQIRLEPVITQNVVTYATVVDAPNPDLRLKPGMTATIDLETARRDNVLRIPNAALRFRPTDDMFSALGQPVPQVTNDPVSSPTVATQAPTEGPNTDQTASERVGLGGTANPGQRRQFQERLGSRTPEERERFFQERLSQMSSEERETFEARRTARRSGRGNGGPPDEAGTARATGIRPTRGEPNIENIPTVDRGARTIDALFGALPVVETTGRVWVLDSGLLRPINIRLGVTDGIASELLGVLERSRAVSDRHQTINPQIALLQETLATVEDETDRATLIRAIDQIQSRSSGPTSEPQYDPVAQQVLQAGTTLVTNITTLEDDSSSFGSSTSSPFIPQFGRRR
jgi:HlyD family secretion protein